MAHAEPQVRAAVVRDIRDALVALFPNHAALVRPELAAALAQASPSDWLPGALLLDLERDVVDAAGEQTIYAVCRRASNSTSASAFFSALHEQALKLVGKRRTLMFRWVPGARAMALRGFGRALHHDAEQGCRIAVHDLPPALRDHRGFIAGSAGSLMGCLDFLRLDGQVLDEQAGGDLVFHVQWWPLRNTQATATAT